MVKDSMHHLIICHRQYIFKLFTNSFSIIYVFFQNKKVNIILFFNIDVTILGTYVASAT